MKLAIIQARTNSSRLPGKVLLPIGGLPMVVLAARRAANTGIKVIVATSVEYSDDALANLLEDAGIQCFRGSLEDTLDRIVGVLAGYEDDTLVFRLTADNVFPDGVLLDAMEEEFLAMGLQYLCCNGVQSGLPYGMSAELTRARNLREANSVVTSRHDREHVTPYIRRKHGETYFQRHKSLNKGLYRCTVDCLDDYLSVQSVFAEVTNPEKVPALELIERLGKASLQPYQPKPASKLVLGTVQLGMSYGIANKTGMPGQSLADEMIKTAIVNGVSFLDTASAYGSSEEVIGRAFKSDWQERCKVITKLDLLAECPADAEEAIVKTFVDESIYRSCVRLQTQVIDVLMLHRMAHQTAWAGAAWSRLIDHKSTGRINALGASVQSPEELDQALSTSEIEFVQMPFNVLDWRWDELISKIRSIKEQRHLTVHVRSALLQGLLVSEVPEHWARSNLDAYEPIQGWLKKMAKDCGMQSVAAFCLNYVKSLDWVDGVVVGMETKSQLTENIHVFTSDDFTVSQLQFVNTLRPKIGAQVLNPSEWKN